MIFKVSEASEARQVDDGWRKAMLTQTSHWNRVRKPAHCNSVKQKYKQILVARKKEISDRCMAYLQLLTQETSAVEQNSSSRDGKKEDRKEEVIEVSMKLWLVFVLQDVILWSLSMKDINKTAGWSLGQPVCRFFPAIAFSSSFWCFGNLQNHPVSWRYTRPFWLQTANSY